jgi:type I restriction enzyme, S subunit
MKYLVSACQNGVWGDEPDGGPDDIACARVADFDRQRFTVQLPLGTLRKVDHGQRSGRLLAHGDLLLEKSGGGELTAVGAVVQFQGREPAVCSNFVAVVKPRHDVNARWLCYVNAHLYAAGVNWRSIKQTTGIQNLDSEQYLGEVVSVPPVNDQNAIAEFLDRETTRIDALIEKKTRFIELLREKRQALIARAVTKGLRLTSMRSTGHEWIGELPSHWTVRRIRYGATLESGHTPDKQVEAYWQDCDIPWVSLSDSDQLRRVDYIAATAKNVNSLGIAHSSARLLPAGTVVMTRDATVGLAAIASCTLAVSQHLVAWVPGPEVDSAYLLCVLRVMEPWLRCLETGATIKTIGMDDIKGLVMPTPPINEQVEIAKHVREVSRRIEALMSASERSIELLRERRAALVTAAVTGQIELRAEQPTDNALEPV